MLEIPPTSPLPTVPPAQDFSKMGFVYITVLGMANQVVPHTGSWCSLATAVNYPVRIAPIVYLAFQAQPASPVGVQLDSGIGHNRYGKGVVVVYYGILLLCGGNIICLLTCLFPEADITSVSGELVFIVL
ncbi:hypothetical protein DSO57_1029359 [Entomophthora muscae]|uniref:Uncharacterized protein n=1 Tax=Entomophthora muscae TaxID=34485 RepID=A0ACC2RFZ8_9FUNG|nr:hypothetical protein DSO57_1029359 [Entomophthora muscae]